LFERDTLLQKLLLVCNSLLSDLHRSLLRPATTQLYLVAQLAAESSRARQKMFELARLTVAAEPEIVQIAAVCRSDLYLAGHAALTFRYPPEGQRVDQGGRAIAISME
jgi:hypothetical protein